MPADRTGIQVPIWVLEATGQGLPASMAKQAQHLGRRPQGTIAADPNRLQPWTNADTSAPLGRCSATAPVRSTRRLRWPARFGKGWREALRAPCLPCAGRAERSGSSPQGHGHTLCPQLRNPPRHRPLLSRWDQGRRPPMRAAVLREARQARQEDPLRAGRKGLRDRPQAAGHPGLHRLSDLSPARGKPPGGLRAPFSPRRLRATPAGEAVKRDQACTRQPATLTPQLASAWGSAFSSVRQSGSQPTCSPA